MTTELTNDLNIRAFIVCVDFADLLSITLPYNLQHFSEVTIVTSDTDHDTEKYLRHIWTYDPNAKKRVNCYSTNSFYADGADFNKWRALEEGLDRAGRKGWICLMDVDILWPQDALRGWIPSIGHIYTPFRRMWSEFPHNTFTARFTDTVCTVQGVNGKRSSEIRLPGEELWTEFPLHRQQTEFAGYSQIFHGDDLHLNPPPWHQTNWRHAGGADSFFQALWPAGCKIRPPFECLHLGPAGVNWCGRTLPSVDKDIPPKEYMTRLQKVREYIMGRRDKTRRASGDPYSHERIDTD